MLSRELAHQIFRSSLTQAFLIGLLSFTQPGIYTAISGLGAGGQATTHTYYVSTVIINSLMTGLAPIFSIFANLISWLIIVFFNTAFFIWGFVVQKYVLTHDLGPLDWATGGYYYNTYVPMQIFKIPGEFVFNWVFWVVGVNDFTSEELSYLSGLIRGFESLGGTLSYVVGVANGNDMTKLSVAAGAFWVVIPLVTYISWRIREKDSSTVVYDEEVSETVNSAKEKQEVIEIVKEESR
ncbi:hypothetical protein KL944_004756 [Ogataea haglerorum]|nr:hypothetical protein KL944_004756 [Ogataea haglerorum]